MEELIKVHDCIDLAREQRMYTQKCKVDRKTKLTHYFGTCRNDDDIPQKDDYLRRIPYDNLQAHYFKVKDIRGIRPHYGDNRFTSFELILQYTQAPQSPTKEGGEG